MLDAISSRLRGFSAAPPPPADSGGGGVLRLGSTGEAVTALQDKLNTLGEQLPVNGQFGPRTVEAVRRFQLANNLQPANGIVTPATQRALDGTAPRKNSGWTPAGATARATDGWTPSAAKSRPAAIDRTDGYDAGPKRTGMPSLSGQSAPAPTKEDVQRLLAKPMTLNERLELGAQAGQRAQAMQGAGVQAPSGPAQARSAELRTVKAEDQAAVNNRVRRMLTDKISKLSPGEQADLKPVIDSVGKPEFYEKVAKLDPEHAQQWRDMAKVQAGFAKAEPGYDEKTRAYSESMRLTLHAGAVLQLASDPNRTSNHYDDFIAGHVTAFRENGGWITNNKIGISDSVDVLVNTPIAMMWSAGTLAGAINNDDVSMRTSAQIVRRARAGVLDSK